MSGVSRPILAFMREGADAAAAARQLQIEAAQRLAVVAGDRAELDVEIEIGMLLAWLFGSPAPASDDLTKLRAVIDVAAHDHAQRAVVGAVGLERNLVAVRQREDREIRRR